MLDGRTLIAFCAIVLLCFTISTGHPTSTGFKIQRPNTELDIPCDLCKYVVKPLADAIVRNADATEIFGLISSICSFFHIEDNAVCRAMSAEISDVVLYILRSTAGDTGLLCGHLFGACPVNTTWSVKIPGGKPEVKEIPPPAAGAPKLRVLHLSDIHVDTLYAEGAEAACNEPICCHNLKYNDTSGVIQPAGKWGVIGNCDIPLELFQHALADIASTQKNIDYIIVTGDFESHDVWNYSTPKTTKMVETVTALLTQNFPGTNIYFAIGNHEGYPVNCFAPHYTPPQFHMDWLYDAMADVWKSWIPDDQIKQLKYNGCYMKKLYPGLRLISLNTGYGDPLNLFLFVNSTDPDGTLTWLVTQLLDAENAGDKVQIISHIPGNDEEAYEDWALNYYNIVNRFESTIVGLFLGHVHREVYTMFYENPEDSTSRPTAVNFAAPSITTYQNLNPAYRIYTIDGNYSGSSFQVLDMEEYYIDLNEANKPGGSPVFQVLYSSAKEAYNLTSMAPAEWAKLIDRMESDDGLFEKFLFNMYRHDGVTCDAGCKKDILCKLRQSHHSEKLCTV